MNLYTADLHFGHDLVIGFDQRPFANVDIMDDTLIDLWNRKVNEDDHVSDNGVHICLCHFPLAEWNGYYKKHLHMYGHIHNERSDTWEFMKTRSNAYNVGCMLHGYSPVSLNEIVRNCSVKE